MKSFAVFSSLSLAAVLPAGAQPVTYTNYIRQFQTPTNAVWDASAAVETSGNRLSDLAINPTGARFELWTIANTDPLKSYFLDSAYVGSYVPLATVVLRSEDPYPHMVRTRVDRPFYVDVTVDGLLSGPTDPDASKAVKFTRHTQSYGLIGTGVNIDRSQAILYSQSLVNKNGTETIAVSGFGTQITGFSDVRKVRGEERFTVFSLPDDRGVYQVPEMPIASKYIQIWPMADGTISGISQGATYRMVMPQIQISLKDLYPSSTTYLQAYKGSPVLGTTGTVVPGGSLVVDESVPSNRTFTVKDYESAFTSNGLWTIELLTSTPFGVTRLGFVSFNVDRTMNVNGSFTTIE